MANAIAVEKPADDSATIRKHEKLIRHLASRFLGTGASIDDLVQEGRIALWKASKTWARKNDATLWTYARRAVFAAMMKCASSHVDTKHEELTDLIEAEDVLEVTVLIHECLEALNESERDVIRRFLVGETFEAMAAALGKSDWYVRDIFKSAVRTLTERAS